MGEKNKLFTVKSDGTRVLECHTRGDTRFTPFNCYVDAFGRTDSIENHYHQCKLFGDSCPKDWREAKQWKKSLADGGLGKTQTGWRIGERDFELRGIPEKSSFSLDDFGIQYYVMLWYRYLKRHPELMRIASEFDDFNDPFKSNFPFCQADVIRKVVREGIESLKPMFSELELLLRQSDTRKKRTVGGV